MIVRTGVLLAFAASAWAAGGAIAWRGHWHPFDRATRHGDVAFQTLRPGHRRHHARVVRVSLTNAERERLRRGVIIPPDADTLDAAIAHELNERAAPPAIHDPSSRAVLLSSQVLKVRPGAYPDADIMLQWPAVAARLEASGALPPHVHPPNAAAIRARATRRSVR